MTPVRRWGPGPYSVAVIHGGPGAPGEVAPVARELSTLRGVLEPFQTESTIEGQVRELRSVLLEHGAPPFILIGFSWGAFLSWIFASRYPDLVRKLILVGCPPFEEQYASAITRKRLDRLRPPEREEAQGLIAGLDNPASGDRNLTLARLGAILARADAFDPIHPDDEAFHCQYDLFHGVWDEACELREKEILLRVGKRITCPVIAIHGDWDPHPAEGVNDPLTRELPDFRFILLEKCGHRPWIERNASEAFFKLLVGEI